jgi:sulfide dehydrogenase [flavocytochrome c] flavoprotein subunit
MHRTFDRRDFLKLGGAAAALAAAGCATMGGTKARVVVIGGGYGGATAAKYIRLWDPSIEVVMVERSNIFTS